MSNGITIMINIKHSRLIHDAGGRKSIKPFEFVIIFSGNISLDFLKFKIEIIYNQLKSI